MLTTARALAVMQRATSALLEIRILWPPHRLTTMVAGRLASVWTTLLRPFSQSLAPTLRQNSSEPSETLRGALGYLRLLRRPKASQQQRQERRRGSRWPPAAPSALSSRRRAPTLPQTPHQQPILISTNTNSITTLTTARLLPTPHRLPIYSSEGIAPSQFRGRAAPLGPPRRRRRSGRAAPRYPQQPAAIPS